MIRRRTFVALMAAGIAGPLVALAAALGTSSLAGGETPEYRIFRPDGEGPHPAVVFASGCSGFAPQPAPTAYERAAEQLRTVGYVVVFADYLGRRGLKNCASGRVGFSQAGKDIVAAASWVKTQAFVDPSRISAMGWSFGGGALLAALAEHQEHELGFSRVVVYYPTCQSLRPWRNPTPVLMLLAGADDVAPGDHCESLVKASAPSKSVKVVLYSGAQHAFDVSELPPSMAYRGGTIGHDPRAAAAAQREIERFLRASASGSR